MLGRDWRELRRTLRTGCCLNCKGKPLLFVSFVADNILFVHYKFWAALYHAVCYMMLGWRGWSTW